MNNVLLVFREKDSKEKIKVLLPEEDLKELQRRSKEQGVSMSRLVNQAINEYIDRYKSKNG